MNDPRLVNLSWRDIDIAAEQLASRAMADEPKSGGWLSVYGPPMGGYPVAAAVAELLGANVLLSDPLGPQRLVPPSEVLVVDDLIDSGRTLRRYAAQGYTVDALYRKSTSPPELAPDAPVQDGWLVFPWEKQVGPEESVVRLLEAIGEDPGREGLVDTPRRVVKAWREMTTGYEADIAKILGVTFDVACDEMVIVRDLPFVSLCEHHVLPFTGTATIAYVPTDRVVGLSKIPRLVEAFSRRLQVQERLTSQIADAMNDHLGALGVGVILRGTHSCMSLRGVRSSGEMMTSAVRGVFRTDPAARAEFMSLAGA